MKRFVLYSAVAAVLALASSNARAVLGTITVSGTVEVESKDAHGNNLMQSFSFSQKDLLFILAQGTGDQSITNKPTKIYYDPEIFNTNASLSKEAFTFYGVFYYSNSVSGLRALDGVNSTNGYYSYMELDENDPILGYGYTGAEGFFNPAAQEGDKIYSESDNKENWAANGNAILYVHSNRGDYDVSGSPTHAPAFYLADAYYAAAQSYAVMIHGSIMSKTSFNSGFTTESQSFTLKGSGDAVLNYSGGVINSGTVVFNGRGPNKW